MLGCHRAGAGSIPAPGSDLILCSGIVQWENARLETESGLVRIQLPDLVSNPFRGSSEAECSALNRVGAGSSPAPGSHIAGGTMDEKGRMAERLTINPGYAQAQLAKALTTAEEHLDPATRERARAKAAKWNEVISGLFDRTIDFGSRTPTSAPGWATLEVVTGGFATGVLMASGPLLPHERNLLATIPQAYDVDGRRALNSHYLSESGLKDLQRRLTSGCYEVTIPEEGALLVAAWLAERGYAEVARELIVELAPYFPILRFYPVPTDRPQQIGTRVFLQDVAATIASLHAIKPNSRFLAQKEAVEVWQPLYDQVVRLFLETVSGEIPHLQCAADGTWVRGPQGQFPVVGGWPCRTYPDGWSQRAQGVLAEYARQRKEHQLCGKPGRKKDGFAQLRYYLDLCARDPHSLSGRDVGRIRLLLARYNTKRGTPDSAQCRATRRWHAEQIQGPTHHEIARAVAGRLGIYPLDGGLDELGPVLQPFSAEEPSQPRIPTGTEVPRGQQKKIERSLCDTVDVLVERGIITSAEALARILPQLTSGIRAAGFSDGSLRHLYAAIYRAFRRRRSLLLLNLEKQMQLEELPWIGALERFRTSHPAEQEVARQALGEVVILALTAFPYTIVPNKLLQELKALAKGAGLKFPLVEEVAADIFMGEFSSKYLQAAKQAAELLRGTLYEAYFGIDYKQIQRLPEAGKPLRRWFQRSHSADALAELCASRAGVPLGTGSPATNGMVIEQQQILTTQNLAVLFASLGLADPLRNRLEDMARSCFEWICRRQQATADKRHARMIMVKNTAYAWRQMIFYLSFCAQADVQAFLAWANEYFQQQAADFQIRFRPSLLGLQLAVAGHALDGPMATEQGARCFLGWSKQPHWLLDETCT